MWTVLFFVMFFGLLAVGHADLPGAGRLRGGAVLRLRPAADRRGAGHHRSPELVDADVAAAVRDGGGLHAPGRRRQGAGRRLAPPGSAASAARSGLVTVVACTLFAAICGSSVATALAMGTILLPAMIEKGYPRSFALGVIGASGTIGIVIPPSLALILYGIVAEQSVPRLFLAGILPGLLQAARVLRLGLVRRAAQQFPDRAGAADGRALAASRCGRCRRWWCRSSCWSASTAASSP